MNRSHLPPLDRCRVLVVNDDGIESAGLALLARAARGFTDDVWVVAPRRNQSARGRAYTLARPVECHHLDARRVAVEGTPVDCVLIALNGLIPGRRPDLVLSGVNQGTNLGEDIGASGTVGACLEAAEQGVPAIAFSQVGAYPAPLDAHWACAERHLPDLLPDLVAALADRRSVFNVNFPRLDEGAEAAGTAVVPAGRREGALLVQALEHDGDGRRSFFYDQLRPDVPAAPHCDIERVQAGYITVTPLTHGLTDETRLDGLRARFAAARPVTTEA